jgi:hypothetical protein
MIKQITDNNVYLEILDKLGKVKDCKITANLLYTYMIAESIDKSSVTLASYDQEIMNGCAVLKIFKKDDGELNFFMTFIWIDAHYPTLMQEFTDWANDKAKGLNIKKIVFATGRDEKIIQRRMGKFGFKRIYTTYAKDVI